MPNSSSSAGDQSRRAHVEQLGARRVAGLDHVARRRACTAARSRPCRGRSPVRAPVRVVEQPARLGGGEHRVERQAADAPRTVSSCVAQPRAVGAVRWSCQLSIGPSGSPVARSHSSSDSRCVLRPTAATRAASPPSRQAATAARTLAQISFASCSTQPGRGACAGATGARAAGDDRAGRRRPARPWWPTVPWSMARIVVRRAHGGTLRAAAAMPSAVRPKWSSRKLALPVGAKPVHAEDPHRGRAVLGDEAGDRGAEAAGDDRLLDGDDPARLARGRRARRPRPAGRRRAC